MKSEFRPMMKEEKKNSNNLEEIKKTFKKEQDNTTKTGTLQTIKIANNLISISLILSAIDIVAPDFSPIT